MIKEALTYDQGSTNGKPGLVKVENGMMSAVSYGWTINQCGGILIPGYPGSSAINCWTDGVLEANLDPVAKWFEREASEKVVSGASGTPLAISDKDGNLRAIVFDDGLNYPLSQDSQKTLGSFGIYPTEKDKNRQLIKLLALADKEQYPYIASNLNLPANFQDCVVEPLTTALLRVGLKLPHGILGWTNADWRGVTNGKDDPQLAYEVLEASGYMPNVQFFIQEQNIKEIYPGIHAIIGGDFQTNVLVFDALKNEGTQLINSRTDVFAELDTVFKFFKMWECEIEVPGLSSTNGSGMYGMNRNGGRVNKYLIDLWEPQLIEHGGDFYQYLDDQAVLVMDDIEDNPFIFISAQSESKPKGILKRLVNGEYQDVEIDSFKNDTILVKQQLTAAVYAGLGCEAHYMLGDVPSLVLYGGFMNPNQNAKRTIFRNCLSSDTHVDWLIMPDSGILTAALAYKSMYGDQVKISDVVTRKPLGKGGAYARYFDKWKAYRDEI